MQRRYTGKVKWFDVSKGFGFIAQDDGSGDVFLHRQELEKSNIRAVCEGLMLEYSIESSNKAGGKPKACAIKTV